MIGFNVSSAGRGRLVTLAIAAVIAGAFGCADSDKGNEPRTSDKNVAVRIAHPPEASDFFQSVLSRLQSKPLRLSDGSAIRMIPLASETVSSMSRMGTGELKPALWLSSSADSVALASQRVTANNVHFMDCASLFTARPTVVFRAADAFAADKFGDLSFASLFQPDPGARANVPGLLVGIPGVSPSGMAILEQLAATTVSKPPAQLSRSILRSALEQLQNAQKSVLQYVASDRDMLDWLAHRDGGQPLFALTTDQQMKSYISATGTQALESRLPGDGSVILDYPLCVASAPWVTPQEQAAAKVVQAFLLSDEIRAVATAHGFGERSATSDPAKIPSDQTDAAGFLFDHWTDIKKPLVLTILVDTSSSMEGLKMDAVKRALELFLSTSERGARRGLTSLMAFSARPEMLLDFTTDANHLRAAVEKLRSSGGSAFRDSVLKAVDSFSESAYTDSRRAILVVTDGKDTSSSTAVEQFRATAEQLINRKRISLYVAGLGTNEQEFGDIPAQVRAIGGRFSVSPPETFTSDMTTLWRELR